MATLDSDVAMVGDSSSNAASSSSKKPKRFEIKKWNAVARWAWDIVVDNCAICRNHIMDLCEFALFASIELSAKLTKQAPLAKNVQWLGVCAIMLFISTVSADGSKPVKSAH